MIQACNHLSGGASVNHRESDPVSQNNSDWKGPQSNLLLNAGTATRSDQVAQGFTQLSLKSLRAWRLHSLSVQTLPLLDLPLGEKVGVLYSA